MKKVSIALFNKNNNAKWDDRINLEIDSFSKSLCILGFKRLSKKKKYTKKIIELMKSDNTLNLKDKKVIIYIDNRLLNRLVYFKDYPFIIREKYIKPATNSLCSNKGPALYTTYEISTNIDFSKIICDDNKVENTSNEELKKITDSNKGFSYEL